VWKKACIEKKIQTDEDSKINMKEMNLSWMVLNAVRHGKEKTVV